jgi:hypothetical protein
MTDGPAPRDKSGLQRNPEDMDGSQGRPYPNGRTCTHPRRTRPSRCAGDRLRTASLALHLRTAPGVQTQDDPPRLRALCGELVRPSAGAGGLV